MASSSSAPVSASASATRRDFKPAKGWMATLHHLASDDGDVDRARVDEYVAKFSKAVEDGILQYVGMWVELTPTSDSGERHAHILFIFAKATSYRRIEALFGGEMWCMHRKGTFEQARTYCSKDGDLLLEEGTPSSQGQRTDLLKFVDAARDGTITSYDQCLLAHPSVAARHRGYISDVINYLRRINQDKLPADHVWRDWQATLIDKLKSTPNDREIIFVVDPVGGTGKSLLTRHLDEATDKKVCHLLIGKKDDLSFALSQQADSDILVLDVARCEMEQVPYYLLENVKNERIFSGKYTSSMMMLKRMHVVVMVNAYPDMSKLSADRYTIIEPRSADTPAIRPPRPSALRHKDEGIDVTSYACKDASYEDWHKGMLDSMRAIELKFRHLTDVEISYYKRLCVPEEPFPKVKFNVGTGAIAFFPWEEERK